MARTEIIEITCDICGTTLQAPASQAGRTFGVDGQRYTIDLCVTHTAELDALLAPFTAVGRKRAGRPARATAAARPARSVAARAGVKGIREWARANGFPSLSDRGRVPTQVTAAWRAAHPGAEATAGTGPVRKSRRGASKAAAAKRPSRRRRPAAPAATA